MSLAFTSNTADTIVAIATACGVAGVGVVRISGNRAQDIAKQLTCKPLPLPRTAALRQFVDYEQVLIDEGILIVFSAPKSFTGEDVVECQIHGAPAALSLLLEACVKLGARLAEPGEFTRRAFINGKLDLCKAEAVADLIHASTKKSAQSAAQSLTGAFSNAITYLQDELVELRVKLEAGLDFADEDIEFISRDEVTTRIQTIISRISKLQAQARLGKLLRDGVRCVIVGAPNVGKSSLMNCLAEEEAAIVTNIPGTTRDAIIRTVAINGVPFHIVDTAGLRETHDPVEQAGIDLTNNHINNAEILIHLQALALDGSFLPSEAPQVNKDCDTAYINVINKWDYQSKFTPSKTNDFAISISVKTQTGIEQLKSAMLLACGWQTGAEHDTLFSARLRHLTALDYCVLDLKQALALAQNAKGEESLIAESIRLAHCSLQIITGEYGVEDLLGDIFGKFCIGK